MIFICGTSPFINTKTLIPIQLEAMALSYIRVVENTHLSNSVKFLYWWGDFGFVEVIPSLF